MSGYASVAATAFDRLVEALEAGGHRVQRRGDAQVAAQCPAHADRNPSLSVRGIEGQVLLHCHGGCQTVDVLTALNLTMADLFDETTGATYRYTDPLGATTRTVHRSPDKRFRQSGDTTGRAQLYRLPAVLRAVRDQVVIHIVEGEKDVHALESLGAVATTAPMGASNWAKVDASPLRGAHVVVVPDDDEPGRKHLKAVLASLDGVAADVRVARAKVGKDAADHVAAGYGLEDFRPEIVPLVGRRAQVTWAHTIPMRRVVWAWQDRIPCGTLSLAAGREGTGKTTAAQWLVAQVTRGTLPGALYGTPRRVLYLAVEDSWSHTLVPRLTAAGADLSMVGRFEVVVEEDEQVTLSLPVDNALLERAIVEHDVALVVLDPLMSLISERIDTHRTRDVRQALDPLARLADRTRAVIFGIAHFNKAGGSDVSSLITGSGAFKDVSRAILGFVRDTEGETGDRVMTQSKNSLGRDDLPSLRYGLVNTVVNTPEGPTNVGRLEWRGESERTAEQILRDAGTTPEDREERQDAADWLTKHLTEAGGEASPKDVQKAARAEAFSWDAIKRAKPRAGVVSRKNGMDGGWLWQLPAQAAAPEGSSKGAKGAESRTPPPSRPLLLPSGAERPPCSVCGQPMIVAEVGETAHPTCRRAS